MRKDCAQEAIETEGWCTMEGKGRGGAKRVHADPAYKNLRKRLKIDEYEFSIKAICEGALSSLVKLSIPKCTFPSGLSIELLLRPVR